MVNRLKLFTGQRKSKVEQKEKAAVSTVELSFKQRRKQDALELAQLVYDMFKEDQLLNTGDANSEEIHE